MDVERKTHEQRKRERDLKKPMNNDDKLIQRSLDKADATPDQAHRKRTMTYVLQRLMAAYLRVLEAAQDANGIRQHRLLVPVLEVSCGGRWEGRGGRGEEEREEERLEF